MVYVQKQVARLMSASMCKIYLINLQSMMYCQEIYWRKITIKCPKKLDTKTVHTYQQIFEAWKQLFHFWHVPKYKRVPWQAL